MSGSRFSVRRLVSLATCLAFIAGSNCATVRPYKVTNFFRSTKVGTAGIKRVAVLPFENLTTEKAAAGITAEEFLLQLGKTQLFDLVERGRIEELWREQDLDTLSRFDASTAAKVGKMLGAQGVILGSVTRFVPHPDFKPDTTKPYRERHDHPPPIIIVDNDHNDNSWKFCVAITAVAAVVVLVLALFKPRPPAAQVGLSVRLVDVESGEVLWQAKDVFRGDQKSVQALVTEREDQRRMTYDVEYLTQILCRELVGTLLETKAGTSGN